MTTATLTLTDFLLARIAEDETAARDTYYEGQVWAPEEESVVSLDRDLDVVMMLDRKRDAWFAADWSPARVLAECEAKRRIVELHPIYRGERIQPIDTSGTDFGCELCHRLDALHSDSPIEAIGYCDTLLALALPYANHEDYNPDWRP